ncbi:MAG TPA: ElyC/SanA/YdcF family protein [Opitutaceae bacterium]
MFWLKKVVSYWLMPLPLCTALLLAGLFLAFGQRRRKTGLGFIWVATALLILFSNNYVSMRLTRPLESRYPAIPEMAAGEPAPASIAGCLYIAVLGSGHADLRGVSATGRLSTSGLARIVEGVRLYRALPNAILILSGPGLPNARTHASVLAAAALSLGVSPSRMILLETAKDTEEESIAVARIAAGARTALVTSAWHMPRAAALFRGAGVNFVACPADFVSRSEVQLRFDSESLERSTLGVHEGLGLMWLRLRGVD